MRTISFIGVAFFLLICGVGFLIWRSGTSVEHPSDVANPLASTTASPITTSTAPSSIIEGEMGPDPSKPYYYVPLDGVSLKSGVLHITLRHGLASSTDPLHLVIRGWGDQQSGNAFIPGTLLDVKIVPPETGEEKEYDFPLSVPQHADHLYIMFNGEYSTLYTIPKN